MTRQELILKCGECTNLNAIFQVTDKCVLACKYCFARGAHSVKFNLFLMNCWSPLLNKYLVLRTNPLLLNGQGEKLCLLD